MRAFTYTSGECTVTPRWLVPNKDPTWGICMWIPWHSPVSPTKRPRRYIRSNQYISGLWKQWILWIVLYTLKKNGRILGIFGRRGEYQRSNTRDERRDKIIKEMKGNLAKLRKEIKGSNKPLLNKRKPHQKEPEVEWILLKIEAITWRICIRK